MLVRSRGPARLSGLANLGCNGGRRSTRTDKGPSDLVVAIFDAQAEQTALVPGGEASVVPLHAIPIEVLKAECKEIEAEARELADSLLLHRV